MVSYRIKLRLILIAGIIFLTSAMLSAQVPVIDTSEYIPDFYNGALEYNLMVAASHGYSWEVKRLINMGAEIDVTTAQGATPLVFAILNNHIETADTLLDNNADPNIITSDYETPLLITIKNLDSQMAQSSRQSGVNNDSIIMLIAEALIRHGADINFQDRNGSTPLNYASIHGYSAIADLLLYFGAEIDKKAYDGTTPIMSAIWAGYDNVADLLVQYGANLESRDRDGFTPFLIAAQNGDTLMMDLLIKNGVDIYEKNNYNWDALDITIKSNQIEAAEWLIQKGDKWSEPSRVVINYYTVAVNYGRKDVLNLLEKNNFPSKYRTWFNQMAITLSSRFNFRDIYTGFGFSLKEPRRKMGLVAGFDTKLWYTRVLVKGNSDAYYQYMDKSSVAFAGVFKDFQLTDNIFRSNVFVSPTLAAAYSFGNKFNGTDIAPAPKFRIMPSLTFKIVKKNFIFSSGIEFITNNLYGIWPIWFRIGCSENFNFDFVKSPGKIIRWY